MATRNPLVLVSGGVQELTSSDTIPAGALPTHSHAETDVTSLTTDLAAKAPLASPTFTGTVTTAAVTVSGAATFNKAVVETPVSLTDAATVAVDASLGNVFSVTLGGNRTMGAPSNAVDGQKILFRIRQDGTGSRTLAWNAIYTFGTDLAAAPTLTTTASKVDYIGFIYDSVNSHWHMLAYDRGYA